MTELPEDLRRRSKEDFDFLVLCQSKNDMSMYELLRDSTLQADIKAFRKKAEGPSDDAVCAECGKTCCANSRTRCEP